MPETSTSTWYSKWVQHEGRSWGRVTGSVLGVLVKQYSWYDYGRGREEATGRIFDTFVCHHQWTGDECEDALMLKVHSFVFTF